MMVSIINAFWFTQVKKDGGSTYKSAIEKRESFLGPHNSRAKIVTLFVKGMVNPVSDMYILVVLFEYFHLYGLPFFTNFW